jgi:hypothetical protein
VSETRPNELEERLVIRLLNEMADAVDPLREGELSALRRPAALPRAVDRRSRRRPTLPARALVAAAAVAAVALGTTVSSNLTRSQPSSARGASAHTQLASFPEGSALHLLLTADGAARTS